MLVPLTVASSSAAIEHIRMGNSAKIVAFPNPVCKHILVSGDNGTVKTFLDSDFLSDEVTVEYCAQRATTLELLAEREYDLVISCGDDGIRDDIAMYHDVQAIASRMFKVIIVAPPATPQELIEAMRAHVFSVFSIPFDPALLSDMIELAVNAALWIDGIMLVSAKPEWIALRVRCSRITAERLLQFGHELKIDLDPETRDSVMAAFRELLLNAMEHGAQFNPNLKLDVGYVRTDRILLYYVRDPGTGFEISATDCALNNPPDDPLRHLAIRMEKQLRAGGFGIRLARDLMDELVYNDVGNEVLIAKYLPSLALQEAQEEFPARHML